MNDQIYLQRPLEERSRGSTGKACGEIEGSRCVESGYGEGDPCRLRSGHRGGSAEPWNALRRFPHLPMEVLVLQDIREGTVFQIVTKQTFHRQQSKSKRIVERSMWLPLERARCAVGSDPLDVYVCRVQRKLGVRKGWWKDGMGSFPVIPRFRVLDVVWAGVEIVINRLLDLDGSYILFS